jgi:hypothetical protein
VSGLLPDYLDLFGPEKINKVVVNIFAKITVPAEAIFNDILHSAAFGFKFKDQTHRCGDCGFETEI